MAGKIFINYRRDDSGGTAGRLHDRLAQTFGRTNLFMDVDHIPAGVDFVDYLPSQVAACDVFLAVIGPNWLDAKDDDGRRRFDNPDDFVAIEIAAALARNIRVIPVLVDGARTPKADKLPDAIKPLVRRNAVEVRNTNFGRDADALVDKVREALKSAPAVPRRSPFVASAAAWLMSPVTVAMGATVLLLVGWIGLYQMGVPVWVPWTPRVEHPDAPSADKAKAAAAAEEAKQQPTPPLGARVPAAVVLNDAEAQRKVEEAEQQRLAAAKAEEERKAKAAGEAEAQRKTAEAEQQRLAVAKAEATPINCKEERNLRSLKGTVKTSIVFINKENQTIRVYWLDYDGKRIPYGALERDQVFSTMTYLTHPWLITDARDKCKAIYMPTSQRLEITVAD